MARSTGQCTVDNQETTWCFDCRLSIAGSGLVDRKSDRLCRVVDKSIVILLTEDRDPLSPLRSSYIILTFDEFVCFLFYVISF